VAIRRESLVIGRLSPGVPLVALLAAASAFAQPGAPPRRPPIPQQLTFVPYHAGGIYDVGETVGWTVTPGPDKPTYSYSWTVRRNNAVVLKEGKLDLSSGAAKIEITGDQPEMLYVAVEPYAALDTAAPAPDAAVDKLTGYLGGNTGRNNGLYAVGAAVAPRKLGLSTPRPADFDAFWNGKLAEQAKIPIHPVLTPVPTDVPGVELSMFVLDALGSKAHGYVAKPAKEGRFPAVIQLQYAGVYALNARGDAQRAAEGWLMINVDSHDNLPSDPAGDVPKGYQAVGNTDREKSYFLNMYLRDSRVLLKRLLRFWSACRPEQIPTGIFTGAKQVTPTGPRITRTWRRPRSTSIPSTSRRVSRRPCWRVWDSSTPSRRLRVCGRRSIRLRLRWSRCR